MNQSKFSENQINGLLKEAEAGMGINEICRSLGDQPEHLLQLAQPVWWHGRCDGCVSWKVRSSDSMRRTQR